MKKTPSKKGLSGITTAVSTIANTTAAARASVVKAVVITAVVGAAIVLGPPMYKKWRRKSYAKKNIGNPNVQAAFIMRKAFTKLEFPSVLGWILPNITLWTNEDELFKIARRVKSIKEVAKAYSILFDSELMEDLNSGFSSDEFKKFFEIIDGKDGNPEPNRIIHIGKEVYWAKKNPGDILKTSYNSTTKKWERYNEIWKTVEYNEKIGVVVQTSTIANGSRFYVVENTWDTRNFGNFSGQGVVWENQIKDRLD